MSREYEVTDTLQPLEVGRSDGLPLGGPFIEVRQFHPQEGGLHFIESVVVADDFVVIFLLAAVIAQDLDLMRQIRIIGAHRSGIA